MLNKIRSSRIGYKIGRYLLSNQLITNSSLYNISYNRHISKTIKELEKRPPMVDIGTTNYCNANCIMCPHSQLKEMGTMELKQYKKIINDCADFGVKAVTLSFFGEPLLDETLIEKIKYAKSKGMSVSFYTNASLLSKIWANYLLKSGLDSITISFDSNNKETYEKIRRGLKFDAVRKNILGLIKLRNKKHSDLKINLVFVELEENKDEVKDYYKNWEKKVDSVNIINMRNWADELKKKGTKESFHYRNEKRFPCALLWQKMVVDWNSNVVLCCDDYTNEVVLGNLKNQTVKEIWQGDKLKKIRKCHVNGEFYKLPLCRNCNKKTVWWLVK